MCGCRRVGDMNDEEKNAMLWGRPLSAASEFDWGKIGGRYGYEWVPVIDSKGRIVDVMDIDGDLPVEHYATSFEKKLPVRWDGRKGAYCTTRRSAQ